MSWTKSFRKNLLVSVYVVTFSFILLEIIFQILPVSNSYYIQPVNELHPNKHFAKNSVFVRQTGFDFTHVVTKKSNNYGYLTNQHFASEKVPGRCTYVIIGDSYVEASQLQNEDTFHAILNRNLTCDIYPIGASGDPLSQYLANTKFAMHEFQPDLFIFNIVSNDFDESWLRYKSAASAHYFDENEVLTRVDFQPSKIGLLLRKSAFFRYLMIDFKIKSRLRIFSSIQLKETINKKTQSRDIERLSYMKRAVEIFVRDLQEDLEGKKIILVFDGDRETIYKGGKNRNFEKNYNLAFRSFEELVSHNKNFSIVDLQETFYKDWIKHNKLFNYEYDFHWNEYGHKLAARSIKKAIDNQ